MAPGSCAASWNANLPGSPPPANRSVPIDQPGQRARESRDVLLRVAAVDAERVQLENFARQVLVDAELAIAGRRAPVATLRELRARPDRSLVVQVQDHRGMRFDGGQHVREPARDVRPDRFVLQRSGEREHLRLVGGDREMVGPEMHQSLAKRFFGRDGDAVARRDLVEIVRREFRAQPAEQAFRGLAVRLRVVALAAQLRIGLEDLGRRRQAPDLVRQRTRSRRSAFPASARASPRARSSSPGRAPRPKRFAAMTASRVMPQDNARWARRLTRM